MTEYKRASEAQSIGDFQVIPKWHKELKPYKVAYVEVPTMNKNGDPVLARIKIASAMEKHLSGKDIIMKVNGEAWPTLSDKQRLALIDHEFCHVTVDEESGNLTNVNHDLEEFADIVRRHGLWEKGVRIFADQLKQLDLFKAASGDDAAEGGDLEYGRATEIDPPGNGGVDTVELRSGNRSVTLTRKDAEFAREAARTIREGDPNPEPMATA